MPLQILPVIIQAPGKLICQALLWGRKDSIQTKLMTVFSDKILGHSHSWCRTMGIGFFRSAAIVVNNMLVFLPYVGIELDTCLFEERFSIFSSFTI